MFTRKHSRLSYAFVAPAVKKPIVYSTTQDENFRNLPEVSKDSEVFLAKEVKESDIRLFQEKTGFHLNSASEAKTAPVNPFPPSLGSVVHKRK